MKILIIHNEYKFPGGEDTVFRSERDLLLTNGHTVETMLYHNKDIVTFFDRLLSALKAIYNPISAHQIAAKVKTFVPDVMHVHNYLPIVSPSVFFVARKYRIPIVFTLHNYRLICPSNYLFFDGKVYEESIKSFFPLKAILKGVYRNSRLQTAMVAIITAIHSLLGTWRKRVDCYIVLTKFAKEKIVNSTLAIARHKLIVKPNFTADPGHQPVMREDFMLFIGRLSEEKGIRTLLKAADLGNFKLLIVGDGPLKELVERAASINSNITYCGFAAKPIILNYLKRCKALIFPSIWYEGFPVTIAEAFSTGTPVVASSLGSMSEIIQHELTGLLFACGDPQDLLAKLTYLINNPDLAERISINARKSYENNYTPQQNYNQLIGIYNRVIQIQHADSPRFQWYALTQSKHW